MSNLTIRFAEVDDTADIFSLINELASYEKLSHLITTSIDELKINLFGKEKFVEILIAEYDNKIVGQALFFKNFSTFLGKPGIYIEEEQMGVRIENNLWITRNGNKDLMKNIPITVEDIEALMKK